MHLICDEENTTSSPCKEKSHSPRRLNIIRSLMTRAKGLSHKVSVSHSIQFSHSIPQILPYIVNVNSIGETK